MLELWLPCLSPLSSLATLTNSQYDLEMVSLLKYLTGRIIKLAEEIWFASADEQQTHRSEACSTDPYHFII